MFIWDFVANPVMESILDWFYSQMVGFLGAFFARWGTWGWSCLTSPGCGQWCASSPNWAGPSLPSAWWYLPLSAALSTHLAGAISSSLPQRTQRLLRCQPVHYRTRPAVRPLRLPPGTFAMEITGAGKSIGELGNEILTDLEGAGLMDIAAQAKWGLGTNPIMLLFAMIFMAYAVIKVFFSNLKRGGILLIQIAVGSLYMFSIPGAIRRLHPVVQAGHWPVSQRLPPATILVAGLMVFSDKASWGLASCWPPERCPASPGPSAWTPPPEPIS